MALLSRLIPPLMTMAEAWSGDYETKGDPSSADCLIGFSFGYRTKHHRVSPGLSNQDLANVALKHFSTLPKILQFEIADAYREMTTEDEDVQRIEHHHIKGRYLDTREVAIQAKAIMDKHEWKTAQLLAHPYHLPRVQAVCDSLGIQWVCGRDERGAVEFDPLSDQKWTRNVDSWRGYEPMAIMFYRLKGWL